MVTLSAQTDNTLIFTYTQMSGNFQELVTSTFNFPSSASSISYDSDNLAGETALATAFAMAESS
jgi:hypothetical protein